MRLGSIAVTPHDIQRISNGKSPPPFFHAMAMYGLAACSDAPEPAPSAEPSDVPIMDSVSKQDVVDYLGRPEAIGAGFWMAGLRVPPARACDVREVFYTGHAWQACAHTARLEMP